jgi:hypothetical protein
MRANEGLSFFHFRFVSLAPHRSATPDLRCEDDVTGLLGSELEVLQMAQFPGESRWAQRR